MSYLALAGSPVHPLGGPLRLRWRAAGEGPPVVLLHGGWGEGAYPWDGVMCALAPRHRVFAIDRAGYGGSDDVPELPDGFHRAMAEETLAALDALAVREVALWGHSDGAVVAAWAALLAPARVGALVLEALHFFAAKPGSLPFFRQAVEAPERFGPELCAALERDHGPRWREVLGRGGRAWNRIIARGVETGGDLYDGRLGEIGAPTLLLHGRHDPRTEPGELDAARRALPAARLALVDAGHSPHTSARSAAEGIAAAARFLAEVWGQR